MCVVSNASVCISHSFTQHERSFCLDRHSTFRFEQSTRRLYYCHSFTLEVLISSHSFSEFKCYSGENENFVEQLCTDCISDEQCMCAKVPHDKRGHARRFCVKNDDGAHVPGEWSDIFEDVRVQHFYCETSLCNDAKSHFIPTLSITALIMISLAAVF